MEIKEDFADEKWVVKEVKLTQLLYDIPKAKLILNLVNLDGTKKIITIETEEYDAITFFPLEGKDNGTI